MKLEDMLKQQEKRGFKQNKLKAKMQTYDEYVSDVASPRPYNTPNVVDKVIHLETRDIDETAPLDFTRDTIPVGSDELIRDTKSDTTPISIRDTILIDNYNEKVETSENGLIDTFKERNDLYHQHKNLNQNLIRTINKKSTRFRYLDLTGNEKRIVDEIINNCIIVGELTTPFIKKIDLSINTGVKVGALKTTICRLKDKNVITAYIATKGRNSSWKISLSAEILEQYIQLRKR